ncbi:MAG: hypothetical protein COV45_07985 [Deltaproteobacteria bacterium CG11_big_fil_rev_8_21_14_0_20_47_16]|nr:MAG: hypothetical protein COV45_07985 [Deltaproteobacteria bacterium CG11_big_fil_rev_8_21_14_0_20_47_16]
MAVHNKPVHKPAQRAVNRDVAQRPATTKSQPRTVSLLQGARDVFTGKANKKQVVMKSNATYAEGRLESPLAAITKGGTPVARDESLLSYLDRIIKTPSKPRKA